MSLFRNCQPTICLLPLRHLLAHVLSFVEEADFLDADLARIGERANRDDQLFPEGVSVSFILRTSPFRTVFKNL